MGTCRAFGRVRHDERLVQILSAVENIDFDDIGQLAVASANPTNAIPIGFLQGRVHFVPNVPMSVIDEIQVVDVEKGLDSRRLAVPGKSPSERSVALIGAGSVGSQVGLLLAEAGVGQFVIVDHDTLDAANLSRHACDLLDLGRTKARALADLLGRRLAHSEAQAIDLLALSEAELDKLVGSTNVVVASTDSPAAQFVANESCIRTKTPGVFIGAYERAAGGEIIIVRPGQGPCLFCAVGFRVGLGEGVAFKERRLAYQTADSDRLEAEPGLGADIAYLSAVATAHVLALLDPTGNRADLIARGREFLLLHGGSAPQGSLAELFRVPFDLIHARVRREEPCAVCGWMTESDTVTHEL